MVAARRSATRAAFATSCASANGRTTVALRELRSVLAVVLQDLLFGRLDRAKPLLQVRLDAQVVADVTPQLIDTESGLQENRLELRRRAGAGPGLGNGPVHVRVGRIRRRVAIDFSEHEAALDQAVHHGGERIGWTGHEAQADCSGGIGLRDDRAVHHRENAVDHFRPRDRDCKHDPHRHERPASEHSLEL